jgi:uncharacterized protein (DUF1778 family)
MNQRIPGFQLQQFVRILNTRYTAAHSNPEVTIMLASSKTQRVDLRISPAAKEMIQAAARAQDKTVSEFLLDSGLTSAAETLADRRLFILDDAQWNAFQAALDAPPRERPRLARLMSTGG